MKSIALSFDTELWDETTWLHPYITAEMRRRNPFVTQIDALLETLSAAESTATFFVTKRVLDQHPETVQKIAAHKHEIGVHGTDHVRLHEVGDQNKYAKNLAEMVSTITTLTGSAPKGFRAPHFSLDNQTRWILPILATHGFTYDSSVFPLHTGAYGISGAPQQPYRISFTDVKETDGNSPLLEVPPAIARFGPLRVPAAGGIYFRVLPEACFRYLLSVAAKQAESHLPMVYLHPHELFGDTPQVRGPFARTLLKYWGVPTALEKFHKLSTHYSFVSIENSLQQP